MRIRSLQPGETALLRTLRIRMLTDAPAAFGQTRFEAISQGPAYWEKAVHAYTEPRGHVLLLAENEPGEVGATGEGKTIVGAIAVRRDTFLTDTTGHIGSLWVAPEIRRTGIGFALVSAALHWSQRQRLAHLLTWTPLDADAYRVLGRLGFAPTGRQFPQPGHSAIRLCELAKELVREPQTSSPAPVHRPAVTEPPSPPATTEAPIHIADANAEPVLIAG